MVWDDGQAGPCMASVHGWCMGAWHLGVSELFLFTKQTIYDDGST